jgi:hypothetical protein
MKHPQLFPKPPKRMKQPRKADIRWRAELAEAQLAYLRTPHWWRIWHRLASRLKKDKAA